MSTSVLKAAAPAFDSVAHVTIPVSDLTEAEAFYVDLLGAQLVERFDRETFLRYQPGRVAEADNSPLHLVLKFGDSPEFHLFLQRSQVRRAPSPHPHIAVRVDADELDAFKLRLMEAGVPVDGPRRLGPPGHASLYFADPWGQLLELVTMGYDGDVKHGPPSASELGHSSPLRMARRA
jgi:catechol 2,3-dioxygenase-like lactoylglutathione lyase family enzyme